MPTGKSRQGSKAAQREIATDVNKMATAIRSKLDEELNLKSAEARREILEGAKDILDVIRDLALGIKLVRTDDTAYAIAPHWPSLKWLAEWYRQLINEDPKGKRVQVEHGLDDEMRDTLRQFMNPTPRALPEPEDGVYTLGAGDYREVPAEDEADDPAD